MAFSKKPEPIVHSIAELIHPDGRVVKVSVQTFTLDYCLWVRDNLIPEHQRRTVNRKVRRYAEDMQNGNWHINAEPVVFSDTGEIESGVHRVLASIRAGVPFTTHVTDGVAPKLVRDVPKSRSEGDYLFLHGLAKKANASQYAWIARYLSMIAHRLPSVKQHEVSHDNIAQIVRTHSGLPFVHEQTKDSLWGVSRIMASLWLAEIAAGRGESFRRFFKLYHAGGMSGDDCPVATLRMDLMRKWEKSKSSTRHKDYSTSEKALKVLEAWKRFSQPGLRDAEYVQSRLSIEGFGLNQLMQPFGKTEHG